MKGKTQRPSGGRKAAAARSSGTARGGSRSGRGVAGRPQRARVSRKSQRSRAGASTSSRPFQVTARKRGRPGPGRSPRRAGGSARPAIARRPRPGAERAQSVEQLIAAQPWDSLVPHLLKIGAPPDEALERLRAYTRLLIEWNRNISNLISSHDEKRVVDRHIGESIEPAAWLGSCGATRWMDFGSGGGLPALPLALVGVGEQWTLVESRRPKVLFLRRAVETLELIRMNVVQSRLEALVEDHGMAGSFEAFTSRATLPLGPTLALASRFVAPGGFAFLWKGSRREDEMRADTRWEESWELDGLLGIAGGQTVVARFSRKTDS